MILLIVGELTLVQAILKKSAYFFRVIFCVPIDQPTYANQRTKGNKEHNGISTFVDIKHSIEESRSHPGDT